MRQTQAVRRSGAAAAPPGENDRQRPVPAGAAGL